MLEVDFRTTRHYTDIRAIAAYDDGNGLLALIDVEDATLIIEMMITKDIYDIGDLKYVLLSLAIAEIREYNNLKGILDIKDHLDAESRRGCREILDSEVNVFDAERNTDLQD